jgi:hypothetical protein
LAHEISGAAATVGIVGRRGALQLGVTERRHHDRSGPEQRLLADDEEADATFCACGALDGAGGNVESNGVLAPGRKVAGTSHGIDRLCGVELELVEGPARGPREDTRVADREHQTIRSVARTWVRERTDDPLVRTTVVADVRVVRSGPRGTEKSRERLVDHTVPETSPLVDGLDAVVNDQQELRWPDGSHRIGHAVADIRSEGLRDPLRARKDALELVRHLGQHVARSIPISARTFLLFLLLDLYGLPRSAHFDGWDTASQILHRQLDASWTLPGRRLPDARLFHANGISLSQDQGEERDGGKK